MPNIIAERAALREASLEDLNHTYRVLKEDPSFRGFDNRAVAEVQVDMLFLSAQYPTDSNGFPVRQANPYKEGTLSHSLHEAIQTQTPIAPRPKAAEKPAAERSKRLVIKRVMATFMGESKPQAGSIRNQVLIFIQQSDNHTCTVEALEAHFKQPVRGYLQKLLEKNHIVVIADDDTGSQQ